MSRITLIRYERRRGKVVLVTKTTRGRIRRTPVKNLAGVKVLFPEILKSTRGEICRIDQDRRGWYREWCENSPPSPVSRSCYATRIG